MQKPILKIYGDNYNTKDGSCIRDFIHVEWFDVVIKLEIFIIKFRKDK